MLRVFKQHTGLLIASGVVVLKVRVMLTFSSYRSVLKEIESAEISTHFNKHRDSSLLVWAVERSARLVPAASCLTKALALRWLLAKSGQECTIRIGVAKSAEGSVEAHAWVIQNEKVLIGGENSEHIKFVPLVDI